LLFQSARWPEERREPWAVHRRKLRQPAQGRGLHRQQPRRRYDGDLPHPDRHDDPLHRRRRMSDGQPITMELADQAATVRLGEDLALALKPGDCLALSGDLGAGKSTLARALIRAVADDDDLEVPSPTFTLVQAYALRIPISHFDLYRLGDPSELDELGFDEALDAGICLVEWPEMAGGLRPPSRLAPRLEHRNPGRYATRTGPDPAR